MKCIVRFIHEGEDTVFVYEDVSTLGLKVMDIITINGIKAEVRQITNSIGSLEIFRKTYLCTSSGVEQ